jgi:hypothetical protein
MVLPIILGIAALGTGALGVAKGFEGIGNIREAKKRVENAQQLYERRTSALEDQWRETKRLAGSYGQLQIRVRRRVVKRLVTFIERQGQKAPLGNLHFLEGLQGISIEQLQEFRTSISEAEEISKGVIKSASTGFSVWICGGNLAVLSGVVMGPALAIGGFQLASKGEKALTEAQRYESRVNIAVERINTSIAFLQRVETRIREVGIQVKKLESRAIVCLDELETGQFNRNSKEDAAKFQQALLLVTALVEISKNPILDHQENPNSIVMNVQAKYRKLGDS